MSKVMDVFVGEVMDDINLPVEDQILPLHINYKEFWNVNYRVKNILSILEYIQHKKYHSLHFVKNNFILYIIYNI